MINCAMRARDHRHGRDLSSRLKRKKWPERMKNKSGYQWLNLNHNLSWIPCQFQHTKPMELLTVKTIMTLWRFLTMRTLQNRQKFHPPLEYSGRKGVETVWHCMFWNRIGTACHMFHDVQHSKSHTFGMSKKALKGCYPIVYS